MITAPFTPALFRLAKETPVMDQSQHLTDAQAEDAHAEARLDVTADGLATARRAMQSARAESSHIVHTDPDGDTVSVERLPWDGLVRVATHTDGGDTGTACDLDEGGIRALIAALEATLS